MKNLESRYYKALAVALGLHIAAAGMLGAYALSPLAKKDDIIEVTLAGAPKKKGVKKPVVAPKQKPKPKIKPKPDDIIDKKLPVEKPVENTPDPEPEEPTTTESGEVGDPDGVEGGKEDGNGGQDGVAVQLPYVTYKVEPNYPSDARSNNQEGTVTLKVLIETNGRPVEAQIIGSSGVASLDASALKAIYRWRFSPAKNNKGKPVRCYVNIPVSFRLK